MHLYRHLFAATTLAYHFDDRSLIDAMLRYEVAWTRACALHGLVPTASADAIVSACADLTNAPPSLGAGALLAGNPVHPLVDALRERVTLALPTAGQHVHFGATTQDVLDSARTLQMKSALDALDAVLGQSIDALTCMVRAHRHTPCLARTLMRQARATTFGLLAAQWRAALSEARAQLLAVRAKLPLQFGGACGTLEGLGARGLDIVADVALALDLRLPALPWHTRRGIIIETATALGMLAGSAGKIARDVSLLSQDEVAELAEPWQPGRGASTAMAHKRNPVACAAILAQAQRASGLVSILFASMPQEHSRALGGWQAEWETLPELFMSAGAAAAQLASLCAGLEVFPARMASNLQVTGISPPDAELLAAVDGLIDRALRD